MNRSGQSAILSSLCAGVVVVMTVFACSSRPPFEEGRPLLPPSEAATPEPAPTCGIHCSRNLKQVLDGCRDDALIETCSADQGCGEGKCVDACTAVAQNKGSVGCDFWTLPPTSASEARGGCFAAMISNTWDRAVSITVEYDGGPLDISKAIFRAHQEQQIPVYEPLQGPLPPGEVAIVFLANQKGTQSTMCPPEAIPALSIDPIQHGTAITKALHIKTDAPVSAYSIAPYGGASSYEPTATLLLPVSSWSQHYLAVSAEFTSPTAPLGNSPRTLQIVANEDDTRVRILPTVDIVPEGRVTGTAAGVAQSWTLAKGEVLQFSQDSLTGSPIEASKPVGVFGGAECTDIPTSAAFCDMLQQQIPPLAQWGIEYAVVPFPSRIASFVPDAREQVPYTIVGGADGTVLTYEPARPLGAPEKLDRSQSASFITDALFVVKSQDSKHPFHVNVYMSGGSWNRVNGGTNTLGDPDFVNVPATDQYLDRYVFFTDFTYPETMLTIVRQKTSSGFSPVELGCGGEITNFKPLGSSGKYEYAWVTLTSGFLQQFAKSGCSSYGRQEARSDGPFAITVWGIGAWASYGYVGGTGLRPINDAEPPIIQ